MKTVVTLSFNSSHCLGFRAIPFFPGYFISQIKKSTFYRFLLLPSLLQFLCLYNPLVRVQSPGPDTDTHTVTEHVCISVEGRLRRRTQKDCISTDAHTGRPNGGWKRLKIDYFNTGILPLSLTGCFSRLIQLFKDEENIQVRITVFHKHYTEND